ncbi:MAG: type II toxin-antitoxin system RelE/ParE family toxin [Deltaproteobacteria bacterium]|nr:type II toxin-antitoxin system RelE/ParE family toxin [Deltaproteobacteria bacterium]
MLKLDITHDALKFLKKISPKQFRQIVNKMFDLLKNPKPQDVKPLIGYPHYWRVDVGEYRIIYRILKDTVKIAVIGKRNDDEVYRQFK